MNHGDPDEPVEWPRGEFVNHGDPDEPVNWPSSEVDDCEIVEDSEVDDCEIVEDSVFDGQHLKTCIGIALLSFVLFIIGMTKESEWQRSVERFEAPPVVANGPFHRLGTLLDIGLVVVAVVFLRALWLGVRSPSPVWKTSFCIVAALIGYWSIVLGMSFRLMEQRFIAVRLTGVDPFNAAGF
jgi:hypothetical protein